MMTVMYLMQTVFTLVLQRMTASVMLDMRQVMRAAHVRKSMSVLQVHAKMVVRVRIRCWHTLADAQKVGLGITVSPN